MKKVVLLLFALAVTAVTVAQNGYRVEIKQVFPKNASVYSNAFDFKREMDDAIVAQTAKLNANSNYQISLTTPSGKETRNIQNITWIQSVNGTKTYHKKQTSPAQYYDVPTVWEGYFCNVDGSRKGKETKRLFIYRVAFADNPTDYKTLFVEEDRAKSEAQRLFDESVLDNTKLVEVVVYRFEGNEAVESYRKTNKEAYLAYQAQKEKPKEKTQVNISQDSIQQQVLQFKATMAFIGEHKDSLGICGVRNCREALEKVSLVPDSVFEAEKLDSIYSAVLLNDVIGKRHGRKVKESIKNIEKIDKTTDKRTCLRSNTKHIVDVLCPNNPKKKKK